MIRRWQNELHHTQKCSPVLCVVTGARKSLLFSQLFTHIRAFMKASGATWTWPRGNTHKRLYLHILCPTVYVFNLPQSYTNSRLDSQMIGVNTLALTCTCKISITVSVFLFLPPCRSHRHFWSTISTSSQRQEHSLKELSRPHNNTKW